jgi:hypothetical protein
MKHAPLAVSLKNGLLELPDDWRVLGTLMHLEDELQANFKVRIFGIGQYGLWVLIRGNFTFEQYKFNSVLFPYVENTDTL